MTDRKYLPTTGELIDRLSIDLMKSVFIDRDVYRAEIQLIIHDLYDLLQTDVMRVKRCIVPALVLMLVNREIWLNEARVRAGNGDGDLRFTHSLNGVRTQAKNKINRLFDERVDGKVDCLAADLPEEFGNWRFFDDGEG